MERETQSTNGGCESDIEILSQSYEDCGLIVNLPEKNTSFKKNTWLSEYFTYRKINKDLKAVCTGCEISFVSRSHSRMINHLKSCNKANFDSRMTELAVQAQPGQETTNSITTKMFARALIDAGWSLKGIESDGFKRFIGRLNKSWKIPSRQELSSVYIPLLSLQEDKKFRAKLSSSSSEITIEFDHWQDANHRCFLGILATYTDGKRYLLDLRDVSLMGHHTDVIVE